MNSHRSGHQHPICIERGEVSLSPVLRCAHLLLLRRQQNGAAPGSRFAPWTAQLQLFCCKDEGDEGHGIQGFFSIAISRNEESLFGSWRCGKQMCLGWHSSLPLRYWTLMQRIENWRWLELEVFRRQQIMSETSMSIFLITLVALNFQRRFTVWQILKGSTWKAIHVFFCYPRLNDLSNHKLDCQKTQEICGSKSNSEELVARLTTFGHASTDLLALQSQRGSHMARASCLAANVHRWGVCINQIDCELNLQRHNKTRYDRYEPPQHPTPFRSLFCMHRVLKAMCIQDIT